MKAVVLFAGLVAVTMPQVRAGVPSGQLTGQVAKGHEAKGIEVIYAPSAAPARTTARAQAQTSSRERERPAPEPDPRTDASTEVAVKSNGLSDILRFIWLGICVFILYKLTEFVWRGWRRLGL